MKAFFLSLTLLLSTAAYSGQIDCVDADGVWKVSLKYENEIASNIQFFKNDQLQKSFDQQEVHVSRMRLPFSSRGLMVYEIDLNGINYFDFERRYHGDEIETSFEGAFLISSNPVGFENHVSCTYKEK